MLYLHCWYLVHIYANKPWDNIFYPNNYQLLNGFSFQENCFTVLKVYHAIVCNNFINSFQPKTSHLICTANQMTGFYMKCKTRLKCINSVWSVDIDVLIASKIGDRKIMQPIRITIRPPLE